MTIKLGVVMDMIESIEYKKDSTLAMLIAAQKKFWELFYLQQEDLYHSEGVAYGSMRPLQARYDQENWYTLGDRQEMPLKNLNVILMRKNPPFDMEFIYSTYILEQAESSGTLVVNKPKSIRDFNEKFFSTLFSQCTPPVMVARSARHLREFAAKHNDVVLKPLDGMGGSSIFRTHPDDQNFNVIVETLTNHGQRQVMIQKYIPEITTGDKRILLIDGEPVPYSLVRIPAVGELRGNLAAGSSYFGQELTDRDLWITRQIAITLQEKGLIFVGLDVIGDYLTEINITSPTCIRQLDGLFDISIGDMLMEKITEKLSA